MVVFLLFSRVLTGIWMGRTHRGGERGGSAGRGKQGSGTGCEQVDGEDARDDGARARGHRRGRLQDVPGRDAAPVHSAWKQHHPRTYPAPGWFVAGVHTKNTCTFMGKFHLFGAWNAGTETGDAGAEELSKALRTNTTLTKLDLRGTVS